MHICNIHSKNAYRCVFSFTNHKTTIDQSSKRQLSNLFTVANLHNQLQLVDKTKLCCNTPHRRSTTVSLETCPLYRSEPLFQFGGILGQGLILIISNEALTIRAFAYARFPVRRHLLVRHRVPTIQGLRLDRAGFCT